MQRRIPSKTVIVLVFCVLCFVCVLLVLVLVLVFVPRPGARTPLRWIWSLKPRKELNCVPLPHSPRPARTDKVARHAGDM